MSTDLKDINRFPPRLRLRALAGAGLLKQAYLQGNRHAGRRIDLAMQVVGILSPEFRHATLFSRDLNQRLALLKALHSGLSHPMLAVALALQNDPTAETRLRNAFPYKRKLLARLLRLTNSLPNLQSRDVEKENDRSSGQRFARPFTAAPEYMAAAKRAISQLGETADRGDLLRCAETILETARLQSVDIS